jgi:hypothetical protein
MTALARSPLEERRMRALSYLLDPAHDARVLKAGTGSAAARADGDAAGRESLLGMVRTLRRGQGPVARRSAERKEAEALFARYGQGLTQQEFIALCRDVPPLAPDQLARLIRLELALSGGRAVAEEAEPAADGKEHSAWSSAIAAGDIKPIAPLPLETLTEFDPRLCVYRDGKWTAP